MHSDFSKAGKEVNTVINLVTHFLRTCDTYRTPGFVSIQ